MENRGAWSKMVAATAGTVAAQVEKNNIIAATTACMPEPRKIGQSS